MDPINTNDLPVLMHTETVAELYALAHAGDRAGFLVAIDDGNPDEAEARARAMTIWAAMRRELGLPQN